MEEAILLTIEYCDRFDFPLTKEELWRRLIWKKKGKGLSKIRFDEELKRLKGKAMVREADGYYMLIDRRGLIEERRKRESIGLLKWEKAINLVRIWKKLPWILGVGVTGSLAMMNTKNNDDIDLLIVTERNRLWLVRLMVVVYLKTKGWRRPRGIGGGHDIRVRDKFCDNLYIDEDSLKQEVGLRSAYEVVQMKPICGEKIWEKFYMENKWVLDFLPNWSVKFRCNGEVWYSKRGGVRGKCLLLDCLNWVAYLLQLIYMLRVKNREVVELHQARFYVVS